MAVLRQALALPPAACMSSSSSAVCARPRPTCGMRDSHTSASHHWTSNVQFCQALASMQFQSMNTRCCEVPHHLRIGFGALSCIGTRFIVESHNRYIKALSPKAAAGRIPHIPGWRVGRVRSERERVSR